MADIFLSHSSRDAAIAEELVRGLEKAGFTIWYYERDSRAAKRQLEQEAIAISECRAVIALISPSSIDAYEVNTELIHAYKIRKPLVPVLYDLTLSELQQRKADWALAFGDTIALTIPPEGVSAVLPRIAHGLRSLGITPAAESFQRTPIITVMGTKGGVGKSSTIAAMAELVASAGHNVMIIDADIESAGITKLIGPRASERPHVWSVLDAAYAKGGRGGTGQRVDEATWDVTPKYLREARFGRIHLIPGRHASDNRPGYEALADISPPDRRNEAAIEVLQDTMDRAKRLSYPVDCILIDSGAENNPLVSAGFVLGTYGFVVCSPRVESHAEAGRLQSMHRQRYPNHDVVTMKEIVNQAVPATESAWSGIGDVSFVREDPSMRLASTAAGALDFEGVGLNWFYLDVLKALRKTITDPRHSALLPDEAEVWIKPYLEAMKDFPEILRRRPGFRFLWPITIIVAIVTLALLAGAIVLFIRAGHWTGGVVTTREITQPVTESDEEFATNIGEVVFPDQFENRVWLEGEALKIRGRISETELTELRAVVEYQPVRDALVEGAVLSDAASKDRQTRASQARMAAMAAGAIALIVASVRLTQHRTLAKRSRLIAELAVARGAASHRELTEFIHDLIDKEPSKQELRWLRDEFAHYETAKLQPFIHRMYR